jgi:hypothetical protein
VPSNCYDPGEFDFLLLSLDISLKLICAHAAFVGVPDPNLLAYWLCGIPLCVLNSSVHPYALHDDWIGYVYARLPLLSRFPDPSSGGAIPESPYPIDVNFLTSR